MNDHVLLICTYVTMCVIKCNAASSCWYIGCQEWKVRVGSHCFHSRFSSLFMVMKDTEKFFRTLVLNWKESFMLMITSGGSVWAKSEGKTPSIRVLKYLNIWPTQTIPLHQSRAHCRMWATRVKVCSLKIVVPGLDGDGVGLWNINWVQLTDVPVPW